MTRIESLKEKLAKKESERRQAIYQHQFQLLPKIDAVIAMLKDEITEAEDYLPKRLSELIDRETLLKHKLADKIIKMHIAADFLEDCSLDLKSALKKLGLEGCSLFPMTDEIRKLSSRFAGIVCHPEFGGLMEFMLENERLIDDMHIIVNRYMYEHLKDEAVNRPKK